MNRARFLKLLAFAILIAILLFYPRLKAIKWIEPTRKEWYGPVGSIESYYYLEYLPSGERKQLGDIYNANYGWSAAEFHCGIFWHTGIYATKEMAMQAVEKWCGVTK